MTATVFDPKPAPPIERLARIEGQSNFLSLLAGIEAGPDTTEDMAALAMSRLRGCVPEVIEAQYAGSRLFRLPLMSMVYGAIDREFGVPDKDRAWVQGAVADAFLLVQRGKCKPAAVRAKQLRVCRNAYGAMRNLAHGVFATLVAEAERAWYVARIR